MARCRSCRAWIIWAYADGDQGHTKPMPIDHDSADDPKGSLAVWRDSQGRLRYRVLRHGEQPADGEHRGTSHFQTCPDADRHRSGRRQT